MNGNTQRGFGAAEAAVICVVVIVIGLLGWKFMDTQKKQEQNSVSSPSSLEKNDNELEKVSGGTKTLSEMDEKKAVVKVVCGKNNEITEQLLSFSSQYVMIKDNKYARFSGICAEKEVKSVGGFYLFLMKEDSGWKELPEGVNEFDCDLLKQKDFPPELITEC